MKYEEVIKSIENLLEELSLESKQVKGKNHYRHIKILKNLDLAIDVFQNKHIRVHVYNVSEQSVEALIQHKPLPLTIPNSHSSNCTKCSKIPDSFPSYYPGPKKDSNRGYYGFQWHEVNDLSEQTLKEIKEAARWLKSVFI